MQFQNRKANLDLMPMPKPLLICVLMAIALTMFNAPSYAQFSFNRNGSNDTNQQERKSIFRTNPNQSSGQSNVYKPPPRVQPTQRPVIQNRRPVQQRSTARQRQQQLNARQQKATPQRRTNNDDPYGVYARCTDRDFEAYQKLSRAMDMSFSIMNKQGNAPLDPKTGEAIEVRTDNEIQFQDKFTTSFNQMLNDPRKQKQYVELLSKCAGRTN